VDVNKTVNIKRRCDKAANDASQAYRHRRRHGCVVARAACMADGAPLARIFISRCASAQQSAYNI